DLPLSLHITEPCALDQLLQLRRPRAPLLLLPSPVNRRGMRDLSSARERFERGAQRERIGGQHRDRFVGADGTNEQRKAPRGESVVEQRATEAADRFRSRGVGQLRPRFEISRGSEVRTLIISRKRFDADAKRLLPQTRIGTSLTSSLQRIRDLAKSRPVPRPSGTRRESIE